jgi:hypothetical protein
MSKRNTSEKFYRDGGTIVKKEMLLKKAGADQVAITRNYRGYSTFRNGTDAKRPRTTHFFRRQDICLDL